MTEPYKYAPDNYVEIGALPAERAVINFDGSCEPRNPGGIAIGSWVIKDWKCNLLSRNGKEVCRGPGSTNNIAEWAGLYYALEYLDSIAWSYPVEIIGDSQLVIKQLTGLWAVKKPHLQQWHKKVAELICKWQWSARWVARELNADADAAGREVYRSGRR